MLCIQSENSFLKLNDTKDFLNKLNSNQIYLINLKYQFLLNTCEYFVSTMFNPIVITNQLDSKELIDHINGEIEFIVHFQRLSSNLNKEWRDNLVIELVYYKLEILK